MSPSNGLSHTLGATSLIAVFEAEDEVCQLKLVLADAARSGPQTQIVVPIVSGRSLQVNTSEGQTADFSCNSAGTRMDARLIEPLPKS